MKYPSIGLKVSPIKNCAAIATSGTVITESTEHSLINPVHWLVSEGIR
jgi:hypothetical protein